MLDIFSKSKSEPPVELYAVKLDEIPGLKEAWRVLRAIDDALKTAYLEKKALLKTVKNATARAAVTLGNGNDEYLEREMLDTVHLNKFDSQIRDGDKYVIRIDQNIHCYKMLKAALLEAFPEIKRELAK